MSRVGKPKVLDLNATSKVCSVCRLDKPHSEYNMCKSGTRVGKPRPRCKICDAAVYKDWVERNRATRNASCLIYYHRNKEEITPKKNARNKVYKQNNPDKQRAYLHARKARNLHASVTWSDVELEKAIYKEAVELEKTSGVKYHVDHIVPLMSPYVCGPQNHFNLQPLTQKENLVKGNRYWPDMPDINDPELKSLANEFYASQIN